MISFHEDNRRGEIKMKFRPEYKMKETEQKNKVFLEKFPKKLIALYQ